MSERNDYGIKLSQPGKDVQRAADSELIFNSSWGNLPIVAYGRFQQVQLSTSPRKLFDHNLGYVPLFIIATPSTGAITGVTQDRTSINFDETSVYYAGNTPPPSGINLDFYYYIFAINITDDFTAPIINTGTSNDLSYDTDYGFKLSKPSKHVSSQDMRDFAVHSGTRSPMVHKVESKTATIYNGSYYQAIFKHGLPYNPIFFGMNYTTAPITSGTWRSVNNFANTETVGDEIRLGGGNNELFSCIILKDPFEISNTQEVSI